MSADEGLLNLSPGEDARAARSMVLRRIARSVGEVQFLLVLLSLAYWFTGAPGASAAGWFLSIAGFATAVLVLRRAPALAHRPKLRLAWQACAMVLFISALVALAGPSPGPLLHLYLLPVITVALALGPVATLVQLALIVVCRLSLGFASAGLDWISLAAVMALFTEMAPTCLVAFLTCALVADRELAIRHGRSLAERDHLTGVYDMRAFTARVEAALARRGAVAILKVDVDHLRQINERFGHRAGDRALVTVAEAIRRAGGDSAIAARFGGDEFLVALPRADEDLAETVANRIRHNVYAATQDFDYAMRRLAVSIGIALAPMDGRDLRTLAQAADRALLEDQVTRRSRESAPFGSGSSFAG